MEQIVRTLSRKKDVENIDFGETKLRRCLSTFELTLIGIGEFKFNFILEKKFSRRFEGSYFIHPTKTIENLDF